MEAFLTRYDIFLTPCPGTNGTLPMSSTSIQAPRKAAFYPMTSLSFKHPPVILHLLDHSLPLHSGYSFRTRAILMEQKQRGWQTHHLTSCRHKKEGSNPEEIDGILFHRTALESSPVPLIGEIWAASAALEMLIAQVKPDIIHAHSPVLNALAALKAGRRHGIPIVYEIRAFWEDAAVGNGQDREGSLRYRTVKYLETWACHQVDAVGVISNGLLQDLIRRGIPRDKLFTVPNAVDSGAFRFQPRPDRQLAAKLGLQDAEYLGFIGSFYDYEGLDDLIAAMPAIIAKRPRAHLILVGGGQMDQALRAQAAASPARDHIHFIGRVPHDEVSRYYDLIDLLVYPRKKMRLTDLVTPLKPLEAMAQGKLVAASDVGGHRELIGHGTTGTLFPAGDPAKLALAVTQLFGNKMQELDNLRTRARHFVETERNWKRSVDSHERVYARLMAQHRAGGKDQRSGMENAGPK